MPIKPSSNDRSGYEYYTKRETVEQLIAIYGGIFQDYDYIWLPFNSKGRPIEEVFKRKYKPYKILTTPDSCYNEELGCNDFWEWKKDLDFHRKIKKGGKTLVFDNPPFKGASGVMRHLTEYNFDYILFSDSMTGLNKTKVLGCGYHILGNVLFDNSA
ncbi:MAG: hypothetical protein FWC41_09055, partial [Firmicutes bacterium]|nr:hypothetical protein [Bacillota bacterium]